MKKNLILACALCIISSTAVFAGVEQKTPDNNAPKQTLNKPVKRPHESAFEKKLGLTPEQKVKARELRKQGFERIKPVMDSLKEKRQEARAVKSMDISNEAKEEKLNVLDKDVQALEKQATKIRKQNMKDFEKILTKEQKKTLKNMKKEGRAKFERDRRLIEPPCPVPPPQHKE